MSIESFEEKNKKFELFKEKISELAKTEKEKMKLGKDYNPHLVEIDPEELNEEDMEIYEKFKNSTLTFGEFSKFRKDVNFRASQKTERITPTLDEVAVYERYKRGEITQEDFLDYWEKEMPSAEFWAYWKRKIAGEEESKFGDSEENFYAYLDNKITSDDKWLEKFAKEDEGVRKSQQKHLEKKKAA